MYYQEPFPVLSSRDTLRAVVSHSSSSSHHYNAIQIQAAEEGGREAGPECRTKTGFARTSERAKGEFLDEICSKEEPRSARHCIVAILVGL